jgi:ribonuclease Z
MMKFGVSYAKVKAIFISHLHLDHVLGMFGLIETLRLIGRTEPLYVFGPRGIAEMVGKRGPVTVKEIDDKFEYREEGFTVSAFRTNHMAHGSFGFVFEEDEKRRFHEKEAKALGIQGRLFTEIQQKGSLVLNGKKIKLEDVTYVQKGKKIVYSGDTMFSKELVSASKGADLLIHEATFADDRAEEAKERKHSTVSDAVKACQQAKAKQLVLTHTSNRYEKDGASEKELKKLMPTAKVASDGMEILL